MNKTIKRKTVFDCFGAIENSNEMTGTITVKTVDEVPVKAKFFKTQWEEEEFPIVIIFEHKIPVQNWAGPGIPYSRKKDDVVKFWKYTGFVHPMLIGTSESYEFGLAADEVPDEYWLDRAEWYETDYTDMDCTYPENTGIVSLHGDEYNTIEDENQCPEYGDMCFTDKAFLVQTKQYTYTFSTTNFNKPNKYGRENMYAFLYDGPNIKSCMCTFPSPLR